MKRWLAFVAVAALAGCTGSKQAALSTSTTATPPPSSSSGTATSVGPTPSSTPLTIDVPQPGQMVSAFGSLWVQSRKGGAVWRIEANGDVSARVPNAAPSTPDPRFNARSTALAAGFGSVWSLTDVAVLRIDPASNRIAGSVTITQPHALAVGEGAVWVVCCPGEVKLLKIDPSTMHATVFADLGTSVGAIGVSAGYVWLVRFSEAGGMDRIDPASGDVVDLPVGYNDRFLVPTPRWLWLINTGSAQRIDPTDGSAVDPRAEKKASGSIGASYSHGIVWINSGTAVGIDAKSGAVIERIPGFTKIRWWWTGGIVQLEQRVWLVDPAENRLIGLPLN